MSCLHLAMWSGPRNISTAMMRSWEARGDCFVCDEPLYAYYLQQTKLPHPGAAEVIAHHDPHWPSVVQWLTGPAPEEGRIFYQKHMAHHLLPAVDRSWLSSLTNCFLIRNPAEMLLSLSRVTPHPTLQDTGLPEQLELFELIREQTGIIPPVLDSREVLQDPRGMLERLCEVVGVPFTERMLHWPPGRRPTDGIWASHWYGAVEQSTGFQPYRPQDASLPADLTDVHAACRNLYDQLHRHRLTAP